jgi:hypothetical protein
MGTEEMRTNRAGWVAAAIIAGMTATSALAETATMTGRFPAQYRDAAMLGSLAVERFGGRDGGAVSSAIERALGDGQHFDLIGGRRAGGRADGSMTGNVSSAVEDSYYKRKEKRCTQRDSNNKCLKEEEVEIRCTRRIANLAADIRIVRNYDGQIVYSVNKPLRQQIDWCEGQAPSRTADEMIGSMVGEIAGSVRHDITPRIDTYRIRFIEGSKGMPKDQVKRWKDLIKLTQRNLGAACQGFAEMNRVIPNHGSILFNLGLCSEAAGDLTGAIRWYQLASPYLGRNNDADQGVRRVQSRIVADSDDAQRRRG